mmetsp:Transcript_178586/g.572459  ORF Transcript_178586/g.572459 Transcript_178586/m.572459 type:complete len:247 (+) Transcript_178586:955-1695(+)
MRPRRRSVPRGLEHGGPPPAQLQSLAQLGRRSDRQSPQALATEGAGIERILPHFELGRQGLLRGLGQQIHKSVSAALMGAYLQEGCLHCEHLTAPGPVPDELEDAPGGALGDAVVPFRLASILRRRAAILQRGLSSFSSSSSSSPSSCTLLRRPSHGVGFSRTCNPVAEDGPVVPLHDPINHGRSMGKHILLPGGLAQKGVATEGPGGRGQAQQRPAEPLTHNSWRGLQHDDSLRTARMRPSGGRA